MQEDSLQQLDFAVQNIGRFRPPSKKRIVWTFLVNGHQHTISLVWSKRTGKRQVDMDGREVMFDRKQGDSVFSHRWSTPDQGQLRIHVLASRATPKRNVAPNFRKYDLIVNNRTFASMPQYSNGSMPPSTITTVADNSLPQSISEILYPNGYEWEDPTSRNTGTSNAEEYKSYIRNA